MSTFDQTQKKNHLQRKAFFDGSNTIARYDVVKYPIFEQLVKKQLSFFWIPEEVDLIRDAKEFRSLTDTEQHIFTSNLKRQILLDSVQGRAPVQSLLPHCSLPELENWIITWSFSETVHSRSYTHIIRNVYADPSVIFDTMMDISEIAECATDISKYYDALDSIFVLSDPIEKYRRMWLCLNAINALEGVRFYVSFACSWAFAELKKMEGNAKIIKFIARDENLHLASTQNLLKILPKDDPKFARVAEELQPQVQKIFSDVVEQEKQWAKYLFKDGSMIGLNAELLSEYVEWIANRRMTAIKVPTPYKGGSNPLPWTEKWIRGSDVQVAPQETQLSNYVLGAIKNDVDRSKLKGFKL